jgi:lipopolysaccharide/colanic/teichoic acid biosynthesis glycosyltransferase
MTSIFWRYFVSGKDERRPEEDKAVWPCSPALLMNLNLNFEQIVAEEYPGHTHTALATAPAGDPALKDLLFDRYARGGIRFAGMRAIIYFLTKKYSWMLIVGSAYAVKRILDIIVSAAMLILLSPVFLITAIAIKIEAPGPALFNQTRVGKWGKLFTMYKFRSMKVGADELKVELLELNETNGVTFKIKHDPRITRVGRVIRKLSIDELPQLLNVLKGDMSLVGPRPPVPDEVAGYEFSQRRRLDAIPGLTCIWQVNGRSNIDFKGQVSLDIQYIESQSFLTDIILLFKTIPAVILGKGAY